MTEKWPQMFVLNIHLGLGHLSGAAIHSFRKASLLRSPKDVLQKESLASVGSPREMHPPRTLLTPAQAGPEPTAPVRLRAGLLGSALGGLRTGVCVVLWVLAHGLPLRAPAWQSSANRALSACWVALRPEFRWAPSRRSSEPSTCHLPSASRTPLGW